MAYPQEAADSYLTRTVLVVVRVERPLRTDVVTRTLRLPDGLIVDFIVILLVAINTPSFQNIVENFVLNIQYIVSRCARKYNTGKTNKVLLKKVFGSWLFCTSACSFKGFRAIAFNNSTRELELIHQ